MKSTRKIFALITLVLLLGFELFGQTPWTQKANFPGTARAYDVAFSIGEYGFVGCGTKGSSYFHDFYKYNEYTNTWTAITNYPGLGQFGNIGFTCEGKGYVGMGWNGSSSQSDMWEYDTISNAWTPMASFPGTTRYSSFPFIIGHKAYFVGGSHNGPPYLNDVWVYDTHANTWTQLSNFPGGDIESYISFAIGKHGYVGDGYWNPGCYEQMYEYDTATDTWTTSPNIPIAYGISGNPTSWIIGSKAFLSIGSICTSEGLRDGWVFDTVTNSWCEYASIASAKISRGLAVTLNLNNHGYLCTGFDTNLNELADLWEYTPSTKINVKDTANICLGDSVHFSDSATYYGNAWNWTFPGGSPTTSTLENPAVYFPAPGTYTAELILTACGGGDTVFRTISVSPGVLPHVTISGTPAVCAGTADTLVASGGGTYSWSNGGTTSSIVVNPLINTTYTVKISNGCVKDTSIYINATPLPVVTFSGNNSICPGDSTSISASGGNTYLWNTGATTSAISVKPSTTSIYSVLVNNGTCENDTTIKVTVNPLPNANISGPTAICLGDSSTLTASGGGTYLWSNSSTSNTITVKPTSNTTYTVTVTNSNNCSKDTTITIAVNTLIAGISEPVTICDGDTTILSATGGTTYHWSIGSTLSSISVIPASTTTYTATITKGGCMKDTTVTVTVNPLPVPVITGNSLICSGDSAVLTVSGGVSYSWNSGQTTSTITVKPTTVTTYTAIVTNSFGCKADTTFKVTVAVPTGKVTGPSSLCPGDSVTLDASGGGTYKWSTGATTSAITVKPASNTTYYVIVSNVCVDSVKKSVTVNVPNLYACCDTTIYTPGIPVVITASGVVSYVWTPDSGISCTTCPDPIVTPTVTTTYTVIGTDSAGCSVERIITVDVSDCGNLKIPNVFTPGVSGINQQFVIYAPNVSAYSIIIYNRWGKEMYKSTDPSVYWSGINQNDNSAVSDGVYYYIVKYTCDGKTYEKDGFVQVIR